MTSRRVVSGAAAASLVLILAGCTGGPENPGAQPEPQASAPPEVPAVCPLTGERPAGADLAQPGIAVKVSNSPDARPQTGLDQADIVYEEIVEGGITRFMALFHCHKSKKVGPVRSARFDDPKIALPYTRVLGYSGSNAIVDKELAKHDIIQLTELNSADAFYRVPPGTLNTHNLFTDVTKLRKLSLQRSKKLHGPEKPIFEFGDLPDGAKPARSVALNFNPNILIEWEFSGGSYKRSEDGVDFMAASGKQIEADNVLVQEVEVNNSPTIVDVAGNPSPDITLTGRGRAFLLRDGKVIKGTWSSKKEGSAPVFETKDGTPFVFAVGSTWIELVPSRKGAIKGAVKLSKR